MAAVRQMTGMGAWVGIAADVVEVLLWVELTRLTRASRMAVHGTRQMLPPARCMKVLEGSVGKATIVTRFSRTEISP